MTVGTVTAQLLYEVGGPAYPNPDVTARFDSVELADGGPDRVHITGVRGEAPPETAKVALNYLGGFRNTMTLVLTGPDIEAKAELAERTLWARTPRETYDEVDVQLVRGDRPDPRTAAEAQAHLRFTVKDRDPAKVGRAFSNLLVEIGLGTYPGYFPTTVPGDASPYGVYWPTSVPATSITQRVVLDGVELARVPAPTTPSAPAGREGAEGGAADEGSARTASGSDQPAAVRRVALGAVLGARSGDKGGDANVGLWVPEWVEPSRRERTYSWLAGWLTPDRVRELLPDAAGLEVDVHAFPHLAAVNVVLHGFLGRGVAANTLLDPQAKGLGERLRARLVDVPADLLDDEPAVE